THSFRRPTVTRTAGACTGRDRGTANDTETGNCFAKLMVLYASTSNPGKLAEFTLASRDTQPLPGIRNISPPEETGPTFEENAALKAVFYSGFVDGLVFADDSGLEVDSL